MGTGLVCLENSLLAASAQDTGSQSLASGGAGEQGKGVDLGVIQKEHLRSVA